MGGFSYRDVSLGLLMCTYRASNWTASEVRWISSCGVSTDVEGRFKIDQNLTIKGIWGTWGTWGTFSTCFDVWNLTEINACSNELLMAEAMH